MGKVGINLGGWYGIYKGGKRSLFVYTTLQKNGEISSFAVLSHAPVMAKVDQKMLANFFNAIFKRQ